MDRQNGPMIPSSSVLVYVFHFCLPIMILSQSLSIFWSLDVAVTVRFSSLAAVYVQANSTIKRSVLRALDGPVHGMGMDSPQLLDLVENCPPEGETLVTRILHILTDKGFCFFTSSKDLIFFLRTSDCGAHWKSPRSSSKTCLRCPLSYPSFNWSDKERSSWCHP